MEGPGHHDEHDHAHGHEHGDRRRGLLDKLLESVTGHDHGVGGGVDRALETSNRGVTALKISLLGLAATAAFQLVIVLVSGSVALLADTIHNFADALTAPTRWHWAQQLYAELILRQGRIAEARRLLLEVRDFYSDPLAEPRRKRIETLLTRTDQIQTS